MKKQVIIIISTLIYSCTNISKIDGLLDEVEVLRDNYGISHIYANNQKDLFFMQGYLAAKDRLFLNALKSNKFLGLTFEEWLICGGGNIF